MSNNNNKYNKIFLNGLNSNFGHSICVSYDPIQNLCAIGFNDGTVKILGKDGYEITFKTKVNSLIKNIYFLDVLPNIIIVTENSVEKWDYQIGSDITLLRIINFKKEEKIISSSLENGLEYLIIASDSSIIHFLNVYLFHYSNHKLGYPDCSHDRKSIFGTIITTTPNQSSLGDIIESYHPYSAVPYGSNGIGNNNKSIYPTCVKISPVNANLLLVGYSNGLVVVWSIQDKTIEKRFFTKNVCMPYCTSVEWTRSGRKIICSFLDGQIYIINYSNFERKLLYAPPPIPNDDYKFKYNENINQGMKLFYSNNQKFLLVKGYFSPFQGSNRSLYAIRFNSKFKDNYSVCGISSNIGPHCIVSLSHYFNDHYNQSAVQSIIGIDLNEHLVEFKLIHSSTPYFYQHYFKKFNNKSMNGFPKLNIMKQFKLNNSNSSGNLIMESVYSSLYQLSNDVSSISGGLNSNCGSEILITSHADNSLCFWDSSDSKNLVYLGLIDISEYKNEIVTFTLINSTLIVSVKSGSGDNDGNNGSCLFIYSITNNKPKAILKRSFKLEKERESEDIKVINQVSVLETNIIQLVGEVKFGNEVITNITPVDIKSTNKVIMGSSIGKIYSIEIIHQEDTSSINNQSTISSIQVTLNGSCISNDLNELDTKSISNISVYESNAFIGYSNGYILILDIDKMKFMKIPSTEPLKLHQDTPIDSINIISSSNNSDTQSSLQKFKIVASSNKEISIFSIALIQEFNQASFELIKSIGGSFISGTYLSSLYIKNESKEQPTIVLLEISKTNEPLLNIYSTESLQLIKSKPLDPVIKLSPNVSTMLSVSKSYSNSFIYQFNNNNSTNNNNSSQSSSTLYTVCIDKDQLKKYSRLFNYRKVTNKTIPNNSSIISNLLGFNFESSYNNLSKVLSKLVTKITYPPNKYNANPIETNQVKKELMNQHSTLSITCMDAVAHKFHHSATSTKSIFNTPIH